MMPGILYVAIIGMITRDSVGAVLPDTPLGWTKDGRVWGCCSTHSKGLGFGVWV